MVRVSMAPGVMLTCFCLPFGCLLAVCWLFVSYGYMRTLRCRTRPCNLRACRVATTKPKPKAHCTQSSRLHSAMTFWQTLHNRNQHGKAP